MALVLKDRVKETTTSTGTGAMVLGGAVAGFQSFSVIGNSNTTYYCIQDATTGDWEVGIGTYSSAVPSFIRNTVLASSNSGSLVNFAAGTKTIFVTYPSERAIIGCAPTAPSGYVLTGGGCGVAPSWQAAATVSCATPSVAGKVYGRTTNLCGSTKTSLGYSAGTACQGACTVAIGSNSGFNGQGAGAVAVGKGAGASTQGTCTVAIGKSAGGTNQNGNAIAIGANAGSFLQGSNAIAIGRSAGSSFQAACSIAIGKCVAAPNAGLYVAPIRNKCTAGVTCGQAVLYCTTSKEMVYGTASVSVSCATPTAAGIVYGRTDPYLCCGSNRTTLGNLAGNACQGINTVAIGVKAGQTTQGGGATAVGFYAGLCTQGTGAVAMGSGAGQTTQGSCAVAIGASAGQTSQSNNAVAIGPLAGNGTQGAGAVAIGRNAGFNNQGSGAINIGSSAGFFCTPANTIVLGQLFFPSAGAGMYISSLYLGSGAGASCTNKTLFYCTSTNKVTYATASGGGLSAGKSIAYTMILGA